MVLEDDHVRTPGTCVYVTLRGKGDLADVNKLRILGWREYTGLPRWAQWNHKDPKKMEKPESEIYRGSMASGEEGKREEGCGPRTRSSPWKLQQSLPQSLRKKLSPANSLMSAHGDPLWTFTVQNGKRIH